MSHPQASMIRRSRAKLWLLRIGIFVGAFLLLLVFYLKYLSDFWHPRIELAIFLSGCLLIALPFTYKFRWITRYPKIPDHRENRKGQCHECGACCHLPMKCIYYKEGRCKIYDRKPKACAEFPKNERQLISHECGYYFE